MAVCPPSWSHRGPPKRALLGRVCKPTGSPSPGVPSDRAPCASSRACLSPQLHPCPRSPTATQSQSDIHGGGDSRGSGPPPLVLRQRMRSR